MPAPDRFALLFDLDGTLLDTIDLLLDCMEFAFAGRAVVPSREEWTAGIGTPLRGQMRAWHVAEHEVEDVVARYRAHQDVHLERMTRVFPGAVEVLAWARDARIPTAVVTSKGRGMTERSLRHVGLLDAFDTVITADDTTRHKPDPDPVHLALARLNVPPERALFVGDSTHDMHAGRAAGTFTGAALWGPFAREVLAATAPTHWLDSLHDVPTITETLRQAP
jgi:pyrophosphatase PpaX